MKPSFPLLVPALVMLALCPAALRAQEDAAPAAASDDDGRLPEAQRMARFIARRLLADLNGRDWLVAPDLDAAVAAEFRAAAARGGTPVRLVETADMEALPEEVRVAVTARGEDFADALSISPALFARQWMESDREGAIASLAVFGMPSLWRAAGVVPVPSGLVFLGAPDAEAAQAGIAERLASATEAWDAIGDRLIDSELEPSTAEAVELRAFLRRHASLSANELGVLLERGGQAGDAFAAYTRAQRLDPDNLSALLNRASAVRRGARPDLQNALVADLNRRAAEGVPDELAWNLTLRHGAVAHPEDFVPFGWTWALSGLAYGDEEALRTAVDTLPEDGRAAVAARLRASLDAQIMRTGTGLALVKALRDPATRAAACLTIARAVAASGTGNADARRAAAWTARAAEAGAKPGDIAMVHFQALVEKGDIPGAREFLRTELAKEESEDNPILWRNLVNLHVSGGDTEGLAAVVEALSAAASRHASLEGTASGARGMLMALRGGADEAYPLLATALESSPNDPSVLAMLLRIEFQKGMRDEARAHAAALLAVVPGDPFANYIAGSLAISDGDFEAAVQHLRRSADTDPQPYVLNDLACSLAALARYTEALPIAEAALKADAQNPAMLDTYATILIGLGRWDDAYRAVLRARALPGGDLPELRLREAAIYLHNGDTSSAAASLRTLAPDALAPADRRTYEELQRQLSSSIPFPTTM